MNFNKKNSKAKHLKVIHLLMGHVSVCVTLNLVSRDGGMRGQGALAPNISRSVAPISQPEGKGHFISTTLLLDTPKFSDLPPSLVCMSFSLVVRHKTLISKGIYSFAKYL